MENVALWHERDISHSSVERMIGPDACTIGHFMLHRFCRVVDGLVVYPENMTRNMNALGGMHFSQRLMLRLIEAGMTREGAYAVVQRNAMRVWAKEGTLRQLVEADEDVSGRLDAADLDAVFDLEAYVRHRDTVFERVFPVS